MSNSFSLYWRVIVRPYLFYVGVVVLFMVLTAAFETGTVGLGIPLIEVATNLQSASPNPVITFISATLVHFGFGTSQGPLIFTLLTVISLIAVLRGAFFLAHKYITAIIAQKLRRRTKLALFNKILHAKYAYLSERDRGAILYDINYPSQQLYQLINIIGNLSSSLISALLLVGFMFYLSPWATLIIGVIGGGSFFLWKNVLGVRVAAYGRKIYGLNQEMSRVDVDAVDGIQVVKSHALEACLGEKQNRLLAEEMEPKKMAALYTQGVLFVNEVAVAAVLIFLGGVTFGLGLFNLGFSKLVVLLLAVKKASPAISMVGSSYLSLKNEIKNVEVLDDILARTPQEEGGSRVLKGYERIFFEQVSFQYPNGDSQKKVLDSVNLELGRGEIVAVVGSTGSGKSTLIKLLLGFYQPTVGRLLVNNLPLSQYSLESLRSQIGYVSQDVFLFHDTLFNNLALWNEHFTEAEVIEAAKAAQLHDFVMTLPQGYQTIVGDRGTRLSGGQCQRVAIARALLRRPSLLIFDEATSALDNITEKGVYEAIRRMRKEAMILVIAHRLTSIKDADRIYVLDHGKVSEQGTHDHLIQKSGIYMKLYHEGEYAV